MFWACFQKKKNNQCGGSTWVKQVSHSWTFVQGRTAVDYLFMDVSELPSNCTTRNQKCTLSIATLKKDDTWTYLHLEGSTSALWTQCVCSTFAGTQESSCQLSRSISQSSSLLLHSKLQWGCQYEPRDGAGSSLRSRPHQQPAHSSSSWSPFQPR